MSEKMDPANDTPPFRIDLFTNPWNYEEAPLLDRKACYANLRDNRVIENLVKDCIAMANTARMLGRPAYILLGISNKENPQTGEFDIVGMECMLNAEGEPPRGSQPVTSAVEQLKHDISQRLIDVITPTIAGVDVRTHLVKDHLVGYIEIPPQSGEHFRLKRDVRGTDLRQGQAWIRSFESNAEIKIADFDRSGGWPYSHEEALFPLPTQWESYLTNQIATLLPEIKAVTVQPLEADRESVEERIHAFVARDDPRLLLLEARAGCGKTTICSKICLELAENCLHVVQNIIRNGNYNQPEVPIPLWYPLRREGDIRHSSLKAKLANRIFSSTQSNTKFRMPRDKWRIFEIPSIRWVVFLDGLDEININMREHWCQAIQHLIEEFPNIQVILSSRPFPSFSNWGILTEHIRFAGFTRRQIEDFLAANADRDELLHFLTTLDNDPELMEICSIPLYLVAGSQEIAPKEQVTHTVIEDQSLPHQPELTNFVAEAQVEVTEATTTNQVSSLPDVDLEPVATAGVSFEGKSDITDDRIEPPGEEPELAFRRGVYLSRVFRTVWKRESERPISHVIDGNQCWIGLTRLAWDFGSRNQGIMPDQAVTKQHLRNKKSLSWILNLGVLLEREDHLPWIHFFNQLVQAYFAAQHLIDNQRLNLLNTITNEFTRKTQQIALDLAPEYNWNTSEGDDTQWQI